MSKIVNVVGKQFGRLTVTFQYLGYVSKTSHKRCSFAIAECDCKSVIDVKVNSLQNGDTISCGCYQRDKLKYYNDTREIKYTNYIGKEFNGVKVINQFLGTFGSKNKKRSYVICNCYCGREFTCIAAGLVSGNTRSCGCLKKRHFEEMREKLPKPFKNYVGEKYGMLTVLSQEIAPNIAKNGRSYLVCRCLCDCGNIKEFPQTYFRKGNNPSCGCRTRSLESRQKSSKSILLSLSKNRPSGYIPGGYLINKRVRYVASKTPEYKYWRKSVLIRDKYTCQSCGKKSCDFHIHHIKEWCNYPELRYDIDNGQTLCVDCHKKTESYGRNPTYQSKEDKNRCNPDKTSDIGGIY